MKITEPSPQALTKYAPSDARLPNGALVKRVDTRARTGIFDYYIVGTEYCTNLRTGGVMLRTNVTIAAYLFVIVDHNITISN